MKKGEVTFAVTADFSKAFDTVAHETVLLKLHQLGFSKNSLRWITSYLTDRSQFVQIDDRTSEQVRVMFGVPKGSILGSIPQGSIPQGSIPQGSIPQGSSPLNSSNPPGLVFPYFGPTSLIAAVALQLSMNRCAQPLIRNIFLNSCLFNRSSKVSRTVTVAARTSLVIFVSALLLALGLGVMFGGH